MICIFVSITVVMGMFFFISCRIMVTKATYTLLNVSKCLCTYSQYKTFLIIEHFDELSIQGTQIRYVQVCNNFTE